MEGVVPGVGGGAERAVVGVGWVGPAAIIGPGGDTGGYILIYRIDEFDAAQVLVADWMRTRRSMRRRL